MLNQACNLISEKNINKIKHNQRPTDEYQIKKHFFVISSN